MYLLPTYCVAILGGLLLDALTGRFLPRKRGWRYKLPAVFLFAFTISMPSWIGDENAFFLFPFFLAGFLLRYVGKWYARLTVGGIVFSLALPLNILTETLIQEALRLNAPFYAVSLVRAALWGIAFLLARRFVPKELRLIESPKLWGMLGGLSLTPLATVLGFVVWDVYNFDVAGMDINLVYETVILRLGLVALPFTALSAVALLAAIVVLSRHEELVERQKLAEIQAVYYQGLQTEQAEVRRIRHDMHNHIAAARGFLAQKDAEAAERYLESLSDTNALTGTRQICENPVANAVLASKADVMEDEGMTANWNVFLPASLPISDVDLCSLLGNALDNAIEAARTAEDKRVLVRARADKGVFMLRVENAVGAAPRIEQGRFRTTKADPALHGIGLDSMREIARRYGGTLDAATKDGRFELVVVMPMVRIGDNE